MSTGLIENAATAVADKLRVAETLEENDVPSVVRFKVQKLKADDPDKALDKIIKYTATKVVDVNAVLQMPVPNKKGEFREARFDSIEAMMDDRRIRARIHDGIDASKLREVGERIEAYAKNSKSISKQLKESSFSLGVYDDERSTNATTNNVFNLQDTFLPSTTSPYAKQQLWFDYLEQHRRAWEAATRNPIAKRICDLIPMFVLGRGVVGAHKSPDHQDAWDEFHRRVGMRARMRVTLRELLIYGEVFLRYFKTKDGLTLRSIDPSTIWDIITNPDDIEDIHYYHQQYTIINRSPVADVRAIAPSTLIIRQIKAHEIDHFKINATSSEKRGRSQLFTILAWLVRFKEFANDRVLLNKMRAMFALDISVKGGATELQAVEDQFATPPGAGAVLIHNDAAIVEFKNANNNANEAKTDSDMLLQIIATGAGISEQFLGGGVMASRASALIRTEPDIKTFETFQEITEDILTSAWERVQAAKGLSPSRKGKMEFIFPALSTEDRSAKLKDIAFAEAMDYMSKERAAEMAAKEFMISTYDYTTEKTKIEAERTGKFEMVIATGLQQQPKIMPAEAPAPGEPGSGPGLGQDLVPKETSGKTVGGNFNPAATASKPVPGGGDLVGGTTGSAASKTSERGNLGASMGFNPKRMSGRGLMNTRATLNRGAFTRGREKRRLKTNQTSGTPVRASGWSAQARDLSLATRRLNRLVLLQESMRRAQQEGNAQMEAKLIERLQAVETKLVASSATLADAVRERVETALKSTTRRVIQRDADGRIAAIVDAPEPEKES